MGSFWLGSMPLSKRFLTMEGCPWLMERYSGVLPFWLGLLRVLMVVVFVFMSVRAIWGLFSMRARWSRVV